MRNGKIQVLGVWLGNSDLASPEALRGEGRTLGGGLGLGLWHRSAVIAVFLPHKLVHAALLAQGGYSREARDRARVLGVLPRRAASPASGQGWCWAWLCMDPPSFPRCQYGGVLGRWVGGSLLGLWASVLSLGNCHLPLMPRE